MCLRKFYLFTKSSGCTKVYYVAVLQKCVPFPITMFVISNSEPTPQRDEISINITELIKTKMRLTIKMINMSHTFHFKVHINLNKVPSLSIKLE